MGVQGGIQPRSRQNLDRAVHASTLSRRSHTHIARGTVHIEFTSRGSIKIFRLSIEEEARVHEME